MAFAKIKALLRKAATRTFEALWAALGDIAPVQPRRMLELLQRSRLCVQLNARRCRSGGL